MPRARPAGSSLPPSSPPSTSSKAFDVGEPRRSQHDYDPDVSDPFGFFAVERKLKVLRARSKPVDGNHIDDNDSIEDLYADDDAGIDASVAIFPTPQSQRLKTRSTALTPHKHKHKHSPLKRKPIASPGHSSTVPSTPSPSKRTGRVRAEDDEMKGTINHDVSFAFDHDHDAEADKENAPVSDPKVEQRARRGVKKARPSTSMLDPKELAKGLEALLPRRPRRVVGGKVGKAVNAKGKTRVVDSSDDGMKDPKTVKGAPKRPMGRRKHPAEKKATTKKATVKGKVAGKVAVKEEEGEHFGLDFSGDEPEKWALERQARIEYFRKLDHYVVEKENVYVV